MNILRQALFDTDRLAWPILLLLLTVLVPSVGTVWMMREAVRNERLATGQRLYEAYQAQLQAASQVVVDRWNARFDQLSRQLTEETPAQVFAGGISQGVADSLLILNAEGRIEYPDAPSKIELPERVPEWEEAERLEFNREWLLAANAYGNLADSGLHAVHYVEALQAQARCLVRAGKDNAAIELLRKLSQQDKILDSSGRSFAAAAELRLLQMLGSDTDEWNQVADSLRSRLTDYENSIPAAQRRFLMSALQELAVESIDWPTYEAEELAAETMSKYDPGFLQPKLHVTPLPGLWSYASRDGRIVGIYRTASLPAHLLDLTKGLSLPKNVSFVVSGPQETSEALLDTSLGSSLAGWRLGLVAEGNPFDESSQQRNVVHAWIAVLVVAITCLLGWLLASALRRRLRLAQLKNDLVATVSHELKTPLASIRLLVDTLLDSDNDEASTNSRINVREYLELISQENSRLTRLIDNFLTFSRLERGKQRFEFRIVEARDIVNQAAAIFRERWTRDGECLRIEEVCQDSVMGDVDSLVTAVVNLLDNARKYSGDEKEICLMATSFGNYVNISVKDKGIGLSPRESRHVFDSFYQVDQLVSRTEGGCGLGLSIVAAIMRAHGGEVEVESQPGMGSKFTLCLPKFKGA